MHQNIVAYYKLQLANDLVMFLIHAVLSGEDLSSEEKIAKTKNILTLWNTRVNMKIQELTEATLPQVAEEQDIDEDVARILTHVHQIEPAMIRQEFLVDIQKVIYQSFEETQGK